MQAQKSQRVDHEPAATTRGWLERPDCRIAYEVTGDGPAIVFAHGIGSNHLTWWQQVAHFSGRYRCVTFSHRGYPPSDEIGVPDPRAFADDLAALIGHLGLSDLRLVAQSMGGWTCLEYLLAKPAPQVRALVLASTCGSIDRAAAASDDPERLRRWQQEASATRASLQARNIAPAAGARMAMEQPALHMLYRGIANASAAFDREDLRKRIYAMGVRSPDSLRALSVPTLFVTGEEDTTYPPFLSAALAPLMPNAAAIQVPEAGHSVYFERADAFNRIVDEFFATTKLKDLGGVSYHASGPNAAWRRSL